MRNITFLFIYASLLFISSCQKEPFVELPETIELGETIVFLNGEEFNHTIEFQYISAYDAMYYSFLESIENQKRGLGFGVVPDTMGNFTLYEGGDPVLGKGSYTSFSHTINEDLEGYTYKLVNAENGFLEVTSLDTVAHTVAGRFKAEFKRTKKNGNGNLDLPKRLFFEGVFHENYVVQ